MKKNMTNNLMNKKIRRRKRENSNKKLQITKQKCSIWIKRETMFSIPIGKIKENAIQCKGSGISLIQRSSRMRKIRMMRNSITIWINSTIKRHLKMSFHRLKKAKQSNWSKQTFIIIMRKMKDSKIICNKNCKSIKARSISRILTKRSLRNNQRCMKPKKWEN